MSTKIQRTLVWCGPVLMGVFFVGVVAAGWVPPPSPGDSAQQTARYYQQHTTGIRIAALMTGLAGGLFAPFVAVISMQIKRVESGYGTLSGLQLAMGALGTAFFTLPAFCWMTAAFRPASDPQLIQALHSAGWLIVVGGIFPFIVQNAAIAIAAFTDERVRPVFPRWVGYFNVWVALLFVPSGLVLFFKHGPFAWNGIFTFWLAATAFTGWLVTMLVVLRRAIRDEEDERAAAAEPLLGHAGEATAVATA